MNRTNRAVLMVLGLLLLSVPLLLLLSHYGVTAARQAVGAVTSIWPFTAAGEEVSLATAGRITLGAVGAIIAFFGIMLLMKELATAADPPASPVLIDDEPGAETVVSADAVRSIATAVSAEAGAREPVVRLWSDEQGYDLEVSVTAPHEADLRSLTGGIREALDKELERQHVPVRRLDVIVYEVV
jgi:hypothetical protein